MFILYDLMFCVGRVGDWDVDIELGIYVGIKERFFNLGIFCGYCFR